MDQSAIADRRQLRRKLTFWRVVAVIFLVAIGFFLYRLSAADVLNRGAPHIARVEITGLIRDDSELLKRLSRIENNDQVKALVVSIASPGGTTYGGEKVYKAIRAVSAKKPVVSDIRTLAASAGYMVAAAGDTIIAGETSITGSIGVIFQYPQVKELMDKVGVSLEAIKSAPLKAEPSPFQEASEEARAMIRLMVMDSYDWFVDLVAERRQMARADVLPLADGSIFTGRQALEARLVDTLGGEDEIRAYLKTRNVPDDLPIVDWRRPASVSPFSLVGMARALELFGFGDLLPAGDLRHLGTDKLFLDGLVSVWQVGDH